MKILIVEDELAIANSMIDYLQSNDMLCEHVNNANL
ncbi:MAG: DNA-binding response OmpR family regulator, partial [Flavobacterium sp.]